MKVYSVILLCGAHLALSGCASTGNQFGHNAAPTQSLQHSQAGANYDNPSENSDTGLTVRDTVDTVKDITQTAREAKSTVYEVKRTVNELKDLMQGW